MSLSTFSFVQLQGVGWLTWAVVVVVAVLALFLIFFFVKRINKAEKETEDEWSLTQRSLFTNVPIQDERTERAATSTAEPGEVEPTSPESVLPPAGGTRTLSSSVEAGEIGKTELLKSSPAFEPEPPEPPEEEPQPVPDSPPIFGQRYEPPPRLQQERLEQERQQAERGTELLASRRPEIIDQPAEQPRQTAPFDDEVWAGLEIDEQVQAPPESLGEARVEHRRREMFEPPIIEPVRQRETFEPPVIAPLESPDDPPSARRKAVEARPAAIDRDVARPLTPQPVAPQPIASEAIASEAVAGAAQTNRASERRSGSVLNLPAEASDAPMVYGEIAADRETPAIGSLSNYGKNVDDRKGRGWKWLIALLGVIVAAVLMYYFIRPFNAWVDRWFAEVRSRNLDASKPLPPPAYKAQVYLARGQIANNNTVAKARGRVTNISDAPLENLSVEVELIRKDGAPPDIRTAPVNPSTLAPTQQGIFEVDLDSRVHSAHRLGKLLSKDGEVLFTAPGQTKQQPQ